MISLSKGQKISLSKEAPGLTKFLAGLGWDVNSFDGADFDLDASAFLCDASGKVTNENDDFIFYNHPIHSSQCVKSSGDNRTGLGDGDDETLDIDLGLVPSWCEKIAITATIHDAVNRRQNFGDVSNAYIRLVNPLTGREVARYDLTEDYSTETAIVVGELYKHNGDWKFAAVGKGWQGGLAALCSYYGVDAA